MEEYYALDCEDFVAGLPCRFRYKAVAADRYGLKTEEVLALTDKELNQVVSLKKLAPYREADPKPKCDSRRIRAHLPCARARASFCPLRAREGRGLTRAARAQVWRQARARGGGAGAAARAGAQQRRQGARCLAFASSV